MNGTDDISALATLPWEGPGILLVDLDAFFASVEQLDHPGWRGKPVIVGGDSHRHGVVSTASYEARAFGVHSAMAASTAARLCPDAIWANSRFDRYTEVSRQVMSILSDESPFVEQVSVDEAFVDVTPTPHNRESPVDIAIRIQKRVAELGVTCSIGVGTSKSVAKVASDMDKPRGLTVVFPGSENGFLDPLPIRVMSGIGPASCARLNELGIRTLGDVRHADIDLLTKVFGRNAEMMLERCSGRDGDVRHTARPQKSIGNEMTFADDLTHGDDVDAALRTICGKVGRRLRGAGVTARRIAVKVRYDDRSVRSVQTMPPSATDNDFDLFAIARPLVDEVWNEGMHLRLLGVTASGFDDDGIEQERLFPDADDAADTGLFGEGRHEGIVDATDTVRDRFGEDAIRFGSELKTWTNTTGSTAKNPEDYR